MKYEEALREWGARRIEQNYNKIVIDRSTVVVEMEFEPGYSCCGGRDPDCYCSFAESPSADVVVVGRQESSNKTYRISIGQYEFDFAAILREIVDAGGGEVTA